MKDAFFGYYAPSPQEYERLWNEGLIVLDTNVLLNMYRLPAKSRNEFLNVLEALKGRLWIPYQVALEFQRRRLTVISSERKMTEDALSYASEVVSELNLKVSRLEIDNRGLGLSSQPLLEDLERANAKLVDAIKAVHESQLDIAANDPVRERLDAIYCNRIGAGPTSQAELDALVEGGESRFSEKIPPGFADAAKDKNPSEATFIHDHIKYQRKFGDLILWRQLISHVKEEGIKDVVIVTADKKEDWWWREQGKTIGPHPELVREIRRLGSAELFWMYSAAQFLEHANRYAETNVSEAAVAEVQGIAATVAHHGEVAPGYQESSASKANLVDLSSERVEYRAIYGSVFEWLSRKGETVRVNPGFPDFIVEEKAGLHGYEVKILRNTTGATISRSIVEAVARGNDEVIQNRLERFTMVVVIPYSLLAHVTEEKALDDLEDSIAKLVRRYPIWGIVVGWRKNNGSFGIIINYVNRDDESELSS